MIPCKSILLAVDTARLSVPTIERAARLAELNQAQLLLADGLPQLNWAQKLSWNESEHIHELLLREKTAQLKKLAASLRRRKLNVRYRVLVGRTSDELIRQVLRSKCDLLIRETKGQHSLRTGLFGSTAMELLRACPCPVWLVNSAQEGPVKKIVAAVDTNPEKAQHPDLDESIVQTAMSLANSFDAQLDLLHVWSVYGERIVRDYMKTHEFEALQAMMHQEHGDCLRKLAERTGFAGGPERTHLVRGDATVEIPKFVAENQTDLLVMGTLARAGVSGFLMGNTSELILNQVQCSVLALKPPGFICPVKLRPKSAESEPTVEDLPDVLPQPPVP